MQGQGLLGRRLRLIRAERKLSLRQAAKLAGLAKETLGDLERGKRHPSDVTLAKLAEVYEISLQELFDLEEESAAEEETEAPKESAPDEVLPDEALQRLIEEASQFLNSLAECNQRSMLEVGARGDYTDLLDLAARRAKQSQLFRIAFEELLQQEGLREVHKENLLAHLNDLDSVVDQTYIMAVKSASGREADVVELPVELRQHVERRQDDIQQARSSA